MFNSYNLCIVGIIFRNKSNLSIQVAQNSVFPCRSCEAKKLFPLILKIISMDNLGQLDNSNSIFYYTTGCPVTIKTIFYSVFPGVKMKLPLLR